MSSAHSYSQYQLDVFDWIENGSGNALVSAVAGSGKTYTLVEAMGKIKGRCLYLAFNKHVAESLSAKVCSPSVSIMTTHSLANGIVRGHAGFKVKFDNWKTSNHLARMVNQDKKKKIWGTVNNVVGLIKANYDLDSKRFPSASEVVYKYFVTISEEDIPLCDKVFMKCMEDQRTMDFNDQILYPVFYDMVMPKYDWIMIDECQDLNRTQIGLIRKMLAANPGARVICVGDPYQSIYAFRGADLDAIPTLIEQLDCTILPLSICYRCAKSIVEEARGHVGHIESFEGQIEGEVIETDELDAQEDDLVLCRTTAPLVKECLKALRAGKKAYVRGKDIGEALVDILEKIGVATPSAIEQYRNLTNLKGKSKAYQLMFHDQLDTLKTLSEHCEYNLAAVVKLIHSIFKETDGSKITFSTVHRAKGLEFPTVWIIRPDLIPHPRAENLEQEENLKYVAITRAQSTLIWVHEPGKH
jgi:DNA helicase-2/ATP-dependent DNA helicase PcrA